MKVRLKFTKLGDVRFISHLDLLRTFERALRRAEIPVAFTQGFNPHPQITFAHPLSLGMTSEGEYVDLTFERDFDFKVLKERLNQVFPRGIKILDVVKVTDNRSIMAVVDAAMYEICIPVEKSLNEEKVREILREILSKKKIVVMKKSKTKEELTDVKPLIYDISFKKLEDNKIYLTTILAAGSRKNLNPEILLQYLRDFIAFDMARIHRVEIFSEQNGHLIPLLKVI